MVADNHHQIIVVTGATGLQGGAVTRKLLSDGWQVRALTRKPKSKKAEALARLGAEVVQGDMAERNSLAPVLEGAYGVFSVQNPMISGVEGEISQGRSVGEAAMQARVRHFIYSSAGTGARDTGVPSWESKRVIEDYLKSLDLPLTILRPMAFMEIMTEKKFFPPLAAWHVMPRLMGSARKVGWLCADDLAFIVAKAFAEPEQYLGKELTLASDVQSMEECRMIYQAEMGKKPARFPIPVWLFERFGFVGQDLTTMWRWLGKGNFDLPIASTKRIHPEAMSVQGWLKQQHGKK